LVVHAIVTGQPGINLVTPVTYSAKNCREYSSQQGMSIYINQQAPASAVGAITLSFDYRFITKE